MVYDSEAEMEEVVGKLDDNVFINQQKDELLAMRTSIDHIIKTFGI